MGLTPKYCICKIKRSDAIENGQYLVFEHALGIDAVKPTYGNNTF
jgi:hypothetical protein